MEKSMRMPKALKTTLLAILGIVIFLVFVIGIYVIYVSASYYRVGDKELELKNNTEETLADRELSILTYNIGFGAYSPDFSFFMDGGSESVAKNKETVIKNTEGAGKIARDLGVDFALFQEMDTPSTRSKNINQYESVDGILNQGGNYGSVYASYFHTPFLMYPIFRPHGKANSGLATFSRFKAESAYRYELPVTNKWPAKLFDLDRCYTEIRINAGDRELVIINIHLTAYDAGGTIRASQLNALKAKLTAEKDNYLIIGGDFNHDLITTFGGNPSDYFDYTKPDEEWVQTLPGDFKSFLSENGYSFEYAVNEPSCRSSAYGYQEGVSRVWAIDGFIVSANINVISTAVIDAAAADSYSNFLYSDHNPVLMKFALN